MAPNHGKDTPTFEKLEEFQSHMNGKIEESEEYANKSSKVVDEDKNEAEAALRLGEGENNCCILPRIGTYQSQDEHP